MKNKSFIALASMLSLLQKEDISSVFTLQKRIDEIIRSKSSGVDPFLEFKIGLHKFFSLQILKLKSNGAISGEQADLSAHAAQVLFEGKCGWWYENYFLTHYAGYRADGALRELFNMLLFEAVCTEDNLEGQVIYIAERERKVLTLHRGLRENKAVTLEEISDEMDLSRERVRQIKDKTMQKILRKAEEKIGIKPNFC